MKQKWMAALLALCLLASLCACGGKKPADETPDRPDTEQTGSASPGEATGDTDCAHEQLTANVTQPTCTQATAGRTMTAATGRCAPSAATRRLRRRTRCRTASAPYAAIRPARAAASATPMRTRSR